jgi:hypothetical protein
VAPFKPRSGMPITGGGQATIHVRKPLSAVLLLALAIAAVVAISTGASAAGPGGWDHLGDAGTPGTDSLNGTASALNADAPGALYVGGNFTDAGGDPDADRIASWNGTSWSAVSSSASQISNGSVNAIAVAGGKVYAGGTFLNAGGDANADFLAVWDGLSWAPACSGPAIGGNVEALQIIGPTLYVGGSFQDGAGIGSADYLLACDLASGAPRTTVVDPAHPFAGSVYALTADSNGVLYAGGGFADLENIPAADNVAYMDGGGWHAMGLGNGTCGCAVTTFVRGLTANGTNVYVGTDATDVAGIAQADNVVKWNGSAWSAMGSNTGGANGWFPSPTSIESLTTSGSEVFAAGSFQNANGDPLADNVARFDGSVWHPVGSNGAGNGPWIGNGLALAVFGQGLYAAGSFTSAGGDGQARGAAFFQFSQPALPPVSPPVTPPATTPPAPKAAVLPPPKLGKAVNVALVKGKVLVAVPTKSASPGIVRTSQKGLTFVALTKRRQIPVGSFLNTRKGTVKLTSARDAKGTTQAGQFSAGLFQVLQSRRRSAKGLTDLALKGKFTSCVKPSELARASLSRRALRRLSGNAKGRFRTRGRYSAATVRGTKWTVSDRCDSTLTKVTRGKVAVRDFRRKKTVVVRAGKSYVARARR